MNLLVWERSRAWRVRDGDSVVGQHSGPLHRPDSMLEWGSITKTVTARIAQRLHDAGELDFGAPVTSYLPVAAVTERVDVASLLGHRAGLPRMPSRFGDDRYSMADPFEVFTTEFFDEQVLPELAGELTGEIGTYAYSNLGYAVLTRILETVTGRSWWDLAQELVLSPLGVTEVGVDPTDSRVPVLHSWAGVPRTHWMLANGPFVGAGGLLSTLEGLESYAHASVVQAPDRDRPFGWRRGDGHWWHNGQTKDHGVWVGIDDDSSRVITVHAIGYVTGTAEATGARLRSVYAFRSDRSEPARSRV